MKPNEYNPSSTPGVLDSQKLYVADYDYNTTGGADRKIVTRIMCLAYVNL